MGQITMNLYIDHLRRRYRKAGKVEKGLILDELCKASDYHRISAMRLLNKTPQHEKYCKKGGRPREYDYKALKEPLKRVWFATDQLCGKLLKESIPLKKSRFFMDYIYIYTPNPRPGAASETSLILSIS